MIFRECQKCAALFQIEIDEKVGAFFATFSIVDTPEGIEFGPDAVPQATTRLSKAIEKLKKYIKDGHFTIEIPSKKKVKVKAFSKMMHFQKMHFF